MRKLKLAAVIALCALAPMLMAPSGSPPPTPPVTVCLATCSAAGIKVGYSITIIKNAGNTTITNNAVPAIDPDFQFTSAPAGRYLITAHINFAENTTNTQGISWYFRGATTIGAPTGTCLINTQQGTLTAANINNFPEFVVQTFTGVTSGSGLSNWMECQGLIVPSSAGTISFNWAQAVSSANATIVAGGAGEAASTMTITRLQ